MWLLFQCSSSTGFVRIHCTFYECAPSFCLFVNLLFLFCLFCFVLTAKSDA